nr:metallophosphoesterase family protein [Gemmatimonadota bacterium]
MRVGLISDVHANLQALHVVLARLEEEGVERLVCLGDVVGYGGDPEACVALVRERASTCVMGNHDAAAVHPWVRRTFHSSARLAVEAHSGWLDVSDLAWLADLPATARLPDPGPADLFLTHGTPGEEAPFTYLLDEDQAARALGSFRERFAAVGHTHVPACFHEDAGRDRRVRRRGLRPPPSGPEV